MRSSWDKLDWAYAITKLMVVLAAIAGALLGFLGGDAAAGWAALAVAILIGKGSD